jgi:uncharacterized circularly permuted ATP-grasp superfamily protein/uncharacterized alpha-E superfamily protein
MDFGPPLTQTRLSFGPPESVRRAVPGLEFDEMVSGDGLIRPFWRPLIGSFHAMADGAFAERSERACRETRDATIAHDVGPDRRQAETHRPIDLLPMLIPPAEWAALEAGLQQRALLFERILADLHGDRSLVSQRLIPAPLVFANPRFLRPCIGASAGGLVQCYAADLARAPDGTWRVTGDRLQAPTGIGAALQNRGLLARIIPELFRAHPVRRIEPFFTVWRAALAALAPQDQHPPRIVVLTPGPYNAAYFEHLYLARELGAALVEGADLTVRDDRLYVKTLGALQPVDVLLRFVDDDFCDPLELRGDSVLGVAGLLHAMRAGHLAVVNTPGTSAVETPALRPYLPQLARHLLGETLLLDSAETEFLGEPGAIERFLRRGDDWLVRPAFANRREDYEFAREAERIGRAALLARVRATPWHYVAERRERPSVMPVWTPGGLMPRPLSLRLFLIRVGDRFVLMPGGLAQITAEPGDPALTPTALTAAPLTTTKDTWVLAGDSEPTPVMLPAPPVPVAIHRPPDDLRSRTADDLFWLGRYTERLDNAARMLRSAVQRLALERLGQSQRRAIHHLVGVLVAERLLPAKSPELLADGTGLNVLISEACADGTALKSSLLSVQRIAQTLRDRLSADMWQIILRLLHEAGDRLATPPHDLDRLLEAFDALIGLIAAFGGMASENMTRVTGWRFLDVGRRIERGIHTASVLSAMATEAGEPALSVALELCDSSITYRARYLGVLQLGPVADLILADETNPRGLAYQLRIAAQRLGEIAASFGRPETGADRQAAEAMLAAIRGFPLSALDDPADRAARHHLADLLTYTQSGLDGLSDLISRSYFSHTKLPQAVGYLWVPR